MTSSKSWLPEAALRWLPLVVLVGGLAVVWTGVSMAADVHRSAGLFPGRVVATDVREHLTADVEYTGPDGVTRTETFEHHQGRVIVPGRRVQIRVWPDERRAEFDQGDEHTGPIVAGSLLTLLGAGATVLLFLWHHGVRLEKSRARLERWWLLSWWWLSRWR
ncbi:hypothetical protein [Amycolatopsis mediterranei]|uniref:Transmembrane protein n=1 Tax=Amycolatopsis mediterranei (strain S699) TaxID=713604 RepID=A0A9R0P0I4_AMYMS|nr:hypothetical protein [Amycolatopsis mediterranei]AEK43942.1 hypothetical protein RAM_27325 [Amycolatopsis mediterranei S699]KDO04534.1 hypothetical protein DV26_43715 [Amycolatopsis mediterranei]KDU85548.1 hypothetical protein DV36_45645 [Amycolatopsis mediterranei]UZF68254.1 hypothetical protein ISP_001311 [Amycolatopsis mediterranei]